MTKKTTKKTTTKKRVSKSKAKKSNGATPITDEITEAVKAVSAKKTTKKKVTKKKVAKKKVTKTTTRRGKKKTVSKVTRPKVDLTGPVWVDHQIHLSPPDLIRWELARAKQENDKKDLELLHAKLQRIGLQTQARIAEVQRIQDAAEKEVKIIETQIVQAASEMKARTEELRVLNDAIQEVYGLDLSRMAYDTTSGRIHIEEPAPANAN